MATAQQQANADPQQEQPSTHSTSKIKLCIFYDVIIYNCFHKIEQYNYTLSLSVRYAKLFLSIMFLYSVVYYVFSYSFVFYAIKHYNYAYTLSLSVRFAKLLRLHFLVLVDMCNRSMAFSNKRPLALFVESVV